jgi:mRNA interferase MazF
VPFTKWKDRYLINFWHIKVNPTPENGLSKPSSLDVLQTRAIDKERFLSKKGNLPEPFLDEIVLLLNKLIASKLLIDT